jgi:choloylglycine hydrolase
VACYELLPWVLTQCATVREAGELLSRTHVTDTAVSPAYPPAQLHWMLADSSACAVLEITADGMRLYPNPVGVLTNNPPFPQQLFRLRDYMGLSPAAPENRFAPGLELSPYSYGMGAMGLPGDLSSQSRFVRAAFTRLNSLSGQDESQSLSQFFHILGAVAQPRGCTRMDDNSYEITLYTSCCNTSKGIYYYTTYENRQITGVDLHREDLEGTALRQYPLIQTQQIHMQN